MDSLCSCSALCGWRCSWDWTNRGKSRPSGISILGMDCRCIAFRLSAPRKLVGRPRGDDLSRLHDCPPVLPGPIGKSPRSLPQCADYSALAPLWRVRSRSSRSRPHGWIRPSAQPGRGRTIPKREGFPRDDGSLLYLVQHLLHPPTCELEKAGRKPPGLGPPSQNLL